MGFLSFIQPLWFFSAFAIGLLWVYTMSPAPTVVMKFPSPYNAGKIKYKDSNDTCFVYKADKVACPIDRSKIKKQPINQQMSA